MDVIAIAILLPAVLALAAVFWAYIVVAIHATTNAALTKVADGLHHMVIPLSPISMQEDGLKLPVLLRSPSQLTCSAAK